MVQEQSETSIVVDQNPDEPHHEHVLGNVQSSEAHDDSIMQDDANEVQFNYEDNIVIEAKTKRTSPIFNI